MPGAALGGGSLVALQADSALLNLEAQCWVLLAEPTLAQEPDRLVALAGSITRCRELYGRLSSWAGA